MKNNQVLRVLCLGDLVGSPGVAMFEKWIPLLKEKHQLDAVIVNGENTAKNGRGIEPEIVTQLLGIGASVITSGNHIWSNKKIYPTVTESPFLLRPANFPSTCPGKGYTLFYVGTTAIAVINIQGRVFMHEDLDCPFRAIESLLSMLQSKTNIIIVDFHAEATSEKQAMRYFLDGKVSVIFGTHTHVLTADERILPGGTAYISDAGYSGALNSALGVEYGVILERFLKQMPVHFKVEDKGPFILSVIKVDIDSKTGKAIGIERVVIEDNDLKI